ncbi:MAG: polysaccharide biosynthesis/export family protein [Nannocystaceae bacterium]
MKKSTAIVALCALSATACVSSRYRFDKVANREGDKVELKSLEDLIADSQRAVSEGGNGPVGISREVAEYDFSNEKDEYILGPNDALNIFVVGHPEMSSQRVNLGELSGTVIQKDGFIYMPVLGKVQAAGMNLVDFRAHLLEVAANYLVDPQLSVDILRFESQKFFVLGEVGRPGAFPVDGDTSLLEGLGLAEGVKETGNLEAAYFVRDGEIMPINLADLLLRGDISRNVLMRRGDVVFVPNASDQKVFVLGEVKNPAAVPITQNRITLAEALAVAGGPSLDRARKELAVIRGGFAKPVIYTIDMEQALLYDDQIVLRPGDRVVVAPTGLSSSSRYMQQVLPFLQGAQAVGLAAQGASNTANTVGAITGN